MKKLVQKTNEEMLTCVLAGGEFSRLGVSDVELVTEDERAGPFFFPPTSLAGAAGVGVMLEELNSTSSFGILAILVKNSFSSVCAITTMSSPALLYT